MDKEQMIQWILEKYDNADDYGRAQIGYIIFCIHRLEKESGER